MSPLVTASCSQGEVLCSGNGPQERFTTSIMWQSDICREEGSKVDDVGNEVFAEGDIA